MLRKGMRDIMEPIASIAKGVVAEVSIPVAESKALGMGISRKRVRNPKSSAMVQGFSKVFAEIFVPDFLLQRSMTKMPKVKVKSKELTMDRLV